MHTLRHLRGTTLLELMASISVLTIALTMGVPTFKAVQTSLQRNQANAQLLRSFALARSEAARREVSVTVCPSSDALACDTNLSPTWPNWRRGWIVFTDANMDKVVNGADVILDVAQFDQTSFSVTPECITTGCTIAAGVAFNDSGYPMERDIGRLRYTQESKYQVFTVNYIGRVEITETGTAAL